MSGKMVILVTGASRGIGRALAEELVRRGHTVYGGGRSWDDAAGLGFTPLDMDMRDDGSVKAAVERVAAEQGRLDVLVNNAGVSHSGSVEDTDLETAHAMFETNYLGVVRAVRATLPVMRKQGSGTIVNVGSAAGKIGIPFQAHYAASKFAVEGLSEALYHELKPFGLRVLLIEPGDVGTTIWERNKSRAPEGSPYFQAVERFLQVKDREMGARATSPEDVAREIAGIIESPSRRLRRPVARGAGLFLLARKLLPDRVFLWAVGRNYRIK
ncbi:MAG TPA: SDR family oxidoreductase [bacterium]|nr:SDR family oxidoreductase [bacterium]